MNFPKLFTGLIIAVILMLITNANSVGAMTVGDEGTNNRQAVAVEEFELKGLDKDQAVLAQHCVTGRHSLSFGFSNKNGTYDATFEGTRAQFQQFENNYKNATYTSENGITCAAPPAS